MKIKAWARYISLISQLGFTMITPILICTVVGALLDKKFNTTPLYIIIFILLGVAGAFRNLFFHVGKEIKKQNKKEDKHE